MNFFSLQDNDLKNLSPKHAVDFFRRLLWAEAARVGIGLHLINVPQCINEGDGGLDAFVENVSPSDEDVIPYGCSGYQIKASDLKPAECKNELHQGRDLTRDLKPGVKEILDQNGTYVLVLYADLTVPKVKNRKQAIIEELQEYDYKEPKIRIYSISQLVGFAERFPSLVCWLKNIPHQCLSYDAWSKRGDVSKPALYVQDKSRQKFTKEIQDKIRNPQGRCPVFRITGLSGLGKTRFIFETLAPDDLKNRVIYVKADDLKGSELYYTLQSPQRLPV